MSFVSTQDSGKSDFLCSDQFGRRLRLSIGFHNDPDARENSPSFTAPLAVKNDEGIFRNQSRRLVAIYENRKLRAGPCRHFEGRSETLFG